MRYLYLLTFLLSTTVSFGQTTWSKKNGPWGGQITDLAVNTTSPTSTLYALGSNQLAYRSTDDGSTWSDLRPALLVSNSEIGNIQDLWIQSDGTIWLLGSSNLYKSTDDGATFTKVNTGSGSANAGFDSGYKVFKNNVTNTLYVSGYHYGDGKFTVFRSTNNGQTWTKAAQGYQFQQLVSDSNGNVYALDNSYMYKSVNDGVTFTAETTSDVSTNAVALTVNSTGSQVNVVTSSSVAYSLSSPFTTWTPMIETGIADPTTYGPNATLSYTPDNSILLLIDNANNKFYTKTGAANWVSKTTTFPSADGDNAFKLVAKSNTAYYIGTSIEGVWKTFNSGTGWSEISTGINSMTEGASIVVADNGNVIVGGQRPYVSTDNGDSFDRASFTISSQYYRYTAIKASTGSPKSIVLLNDQGPSMKSTNNGVSWSTLAQAPSGRFSTPDGNKILSYDNSTFSFSGNQGSTWTSLTITGLPTSGNLSVYSAAMDNSTIPVIYMWGYDYTSGAGVMKMWKITLNSATPTTGTATTIALTTIGVTNIYDVKYYNNSIYVLGNASSGSALLSITTNGGTSWATKAMPSNVQSIYIDRITGYIFAARSNNSAAYSVYLSRDNGDSYVTTTITMPTERTQITDIELDPSVGYAYAGFGSSAIYRTDASVIIPTAPTGLASSGTSPDKITLKWVDNATNETDFVIEKQVGASYVEVSEENSAQNTGMTVHTEISGLTANTSYTFRVAAKNTAGLSNYITLTLSTPAICTSAIPDNRSWNGNVNGSTTLTNVGIVSKGNGVYSITDVSNGADGVSGPQPMLFTEDCTATYIQYDYPLFANGNGTWTSASNTLVLKWTTEDIAPKTGTVTLTVNGSDPTPAAPTNAAAVVLDASTIEVSWTSSLFAKTFTVERSSTSAFTIIDQSFVVNYPSTSYKDNTALAYGTSYYYRVKAANTTGTSSTTAVVSVYFNKPNFVLSGTPIETVTGMNSAGVVWADFNNDGFDDVIFTRFIIQPGQSAIPLIYKNNGAGSFTVVGSESGIVASQDLSMSVADYDNDGKTDIFFTSSGTQNYLYKGNGDFTFTKVTSPMDANVPNDFESIYLANTWFDFNNDGLLDIVVAPQDDDVTVKSFIQSPAGTFTQQTTGDLGTLKMSGGVVLWADYDNDGKQDLFVPEDEDALPNRLFKNNGDGTLTKVNGAPFDTDLGTRTFGAAWGDYNNDSFLDLYIASGSDGISNILYKNNGNGTFTKQTLSPITDAKTGEINSYAATWVDINNDTFLDLVVANIGGENYLYINNNGTTFTKVQYEKLTDPRISNFGMAASDYNHDGFVDLAFSAIDPAGFETTAPSTAYNLLFKNINTTGNWVELKLVGTASNKSAVGARVTLSAGGKTMIREVQSTTSFISQNSQVVHFGLGSAATITSISIKWPSGVVQDVTGINVNSINTVTENADPIPPVFVTVPSPSTTVNKSLLTTDQVISAMITDNKPGLTAKIYVRSVSGSTYTPIDGTKPTDLNSWNFSLPVSAFDAAGVQYYFEAKDAVGNITRSPAGSDLNKILITYDNKSAQIPAALIGSGGAVTGWKVIAIPFELGSNNGVQDVFDELTGNNTLTNKADYRLLTYTETPSPAWQDYPEGFSTINRGVGYFINVKTPVSIFVGDNVTAPANTRSNLFTMTLKKGWNMIGNPYLTQIDWDNAVTLNNLTGSANVFKRFSGGSYSNATIISAYEGGFVHADADVQVSIPFNGQVAQGGRMQEITFGENEWVLPIDIQQGEITNTFGGVGMHSKASLSYDVLDDINGPRWFEFTEMNFKHPETVIRNFARDVVPVSEEFVWEFTFNSNLQDVATLKWDNDSFVSGKDLYLYDLETQTPINMKEMSSYSFSGASSRSFRVYFGEDVLSKIVPAKLMIGVPYPNPTAGNSTVQFSIPEKSGSGIVNVSLEVFDMTGRKVITIANGSYVPGFYHAQWQANESQGSGVYIYRLIAGGEVVTSKVVLRK